MLQGLMKLRVDEILYCVQLVCTRPVEPASQKTTNTTRILACWSARSLTDMLGQYGTMPLSPEMASIFFSNEECKALRLDYFEFLSSCALAICLFKSATALHSLKHSGQMLIVAVCCHLLLPQCKMKNSDV